VVVQQQYLKDARGEDLGIVVRSSGDEGFAKAGTRSDQKGTEPSFGKSLTQKLAAWSMGVQIFPSSSLRANKGGVLSVLIHTRKKGGGWSATSGS